MTSELRRRKKKRVQREIQPHPALGRSHIKTQRLNHLFKAFHQVERDIRCLYRFAWVRVVYNSPMWHGVLSCLRPHPQTSPKNTKAKPFANPSDPRFEPTREDDKASGGRERIYEYIVIALNVLDLHGLYCFFCIAEQPTVPTMVVVLMLTFLVIDSFIFMKIT